MNECKTPPARQLDGGRGVNHRMEEDGEWRMHREKERDAGPNDEQEHLE